MDTTSWGNGGLVVKGVNALSSVSYLHANPGVAPTKIVATHVPEAVVPREYKLYQNFPNPFNPTTTIQFDLPVQSLVTLKVYNILGQEVATLFDRDQMDEGMVHAQFNANSYASGVYFYRLIATPLASTEEGVVMHEYIQTTKMVLIK